ncbi:MAG: helicase HerA-like domain-containing protein [Bacteroidota bacterium]
MEFEKTIQEGYAFEEDYFSIGSAVFEGEPVKGAVVNIPLKTLNRHGLISGATGTGKTKTLQIIAEQLSANGVGVLLMDFKGDLSGVAQPGTTNKHVVHRHEMMEQPWEAEGFPVELMSLSDQEGVRLRATVSEFGPVLFSKILGANDTQQGIISILFKYCDDFDLPLLDLKDFRKVLQFISNEGKEEIEEEYGKVSGSSVGAIMRKLVELESQGADLFFGEKSFEVEDLVRTDRDGRGFINIIRLDDIQDRPKLFSTFMLCLLSEIYQKFPEEGDMDKPKLAIFIDEAHLVFSEASRALLDQLESIVKLIRSKAVGVFFCTQNPTDIPDSVLSQLGLKVQHALRAFTAKDRKSIKMVAENYPITEFYDVDQTLTQLGIGEAFVTVLNKKGIPTPLVHTLLRSPSSRMDILTNKERKEVLKSSRLIDEYNQVIDRESAHEILGKKLEKARKEQEAREAREAKEKAKRSTSTRRRSRKEESAFEAFINHTTTRQIGRTVARELARGLLGVLGVKR